MGAGSSGKVFLAEDLLRQGKYAIKTISLDHIIENDPKALMLRNEIISH